MAIARFLFVLLLVVPLGILMLYFINKLNIEFATSMKKKTASDDPHSNRSSNQRIKRETSPGGAQPARQKSQPSGSQRVKRKPDPEKDGRRTTSKRKRRKERRNKKKDRE